MSNSPVALSFKFSDYTTTGNFYELQEYGSVLSAINARPEISITNSRPDRK
jgi:hypothetical protein